MDNTLEIFYQIITYFFRNPWTQKPQNPKFRMIFSVKDDISTETHIEYRIGLTVYKVYKLFKTTAISNNIEFVITYLNFVNSQW